MGDRITTTKTNMNYLKCGDVTDDELIELYTRKTPKTKENNKTSISTPMKEELFRGIARKEVEIFTKIQENALRRYGDSINYVFIDMTAGNGFCVCPNEIVVEGSARILADIVTKSKLNNYKMYFIEKDKSEHEKLSLTFQSGSLLAKAGR